MLKKIRCLLLPGLLLISGILLVWAYLPVKHQVVNLTILPREMMLPSSGHLNNPALLENRWVRLEWPSSLRIGDEGVIMLDFEPDPEDISTPNAPTSFSDIYRGYNLMVEGRFEVAGIAIDPNNPIRESLPPGQPVRFKWTASAAKVGVYFGNVWFSLRFLPLDGSQATQLPIFVHEVEIQSISFLGLNGTLARLLGGGGALIGVILVLNDMIKGWKILSHYKNTNCDA